MFIVFCGSDRNKVRDEATAYIDAYLPTGGTLSTIESNDFEPGQLADALGSQSLFGGCQWFVLDTPSGNTDFAEAVSGALQEIVDSSNTFVILEGSLTAAVKKQYKKLAADFREFTIEKGEFFQMFSLAEALSVKDKRRLWALLHEARLYGLRDEEIIGMFWWQLKSLRLAALTKSASDAGMKEFPYNKAKRSLKSFREDEVTTLSQSLLDLYHSAHAGECDIGLALEQWVLKL